MNEYELLYALSGGLSEAEAGKVSDSISNTLMKLGGKTAGEDTAWGRRKLAYPIDKDDHGWYVISRFSIDRAKLDDFQKALNLEPKVIRTVLVKASELPSAEEAERAREAAEKAESDRDKPKRDSARGPEPTTDAIPETLKTVKKAPAKQPAPMTATTTATATAKPAEKAKSAEKKEPATPKDAAERQKALDEKLGEILKD